MTTRPTMRIDLTDNAFWPGIPGLGLLPERARRRLIEERRRLENTQRPPADGAEFRIITRDNAGRTVVGDWIRP